MKPARETEMVPPQDLEEEAVALVREWLRDSARLPAAPAAARLAKLLKDDRGLDFAVGFVDGVVRPEDLGAAARRLRELAAVAPAFLSVPLRGALKIGGALAPVLPRVVVPLARRVFRRMVRHLVIDATDAKLGPALANITGRDTRLNINLLGEAVLGSHEARVRLDRTQALLERPDVDYVSVKVSASVSPHNHWAFDDAVIDIASQLVPLFRRAAAASPPKFINLDMEEYKDLELTLAVFTRILDRAEFRGLEAGIVLQAYLPDALGAMKRVQDWAARRVAGGGAPVKVRVVKGANLPMETVQAVVHGWPVVTWSSKQQTDTNYKAVLDYALMPDRIANVRIGVAGHNLFDIALAWLLANARGVAAGIDIEMLLGMAAGQAHAIKRDVGSLLLYTPVVHPDEFDVAIAYLVRRLEEGASDANFLSALFDLATDDALFERERSRFSQSLAALGTISDTRDRPRIPAANRQQDRSRYDQAGAEARVAASTAGGLAAFTNTPDTDPDLSGNRAWGREIAGRMVASTLGAEVVAQAEIRDAGELETVIARGVAAAVGWQELGADERARILHRAGERLEERRGELLEVMGSECGKTLDQGDPEVSEAIDFAHYYAGLGQQLERMDGATCVPQSLSAVIPPWNFPTAIPAGGTLAALAAGSAVVLKPAQRAARTAAVLAAALWDAGVPRDVLQLAQFPDRDLARSLVADSRVDRLILTGSYDTAVRFRELRRDLPILAETSGKNAIIVTPSADFDLAVRDIVHSAFGHAGQKCSAASLVILVGSVAKSRRFKRQLLDAVSSLVVGTPDQLTTQMGPLIAPPEGKLLRGLTTLGDGEHWVIPPKPVTDGGALAFDGDGQTKLWRPGIRAGVARGSEYHLTEYFGPILGVMTAATLDEAIDVVNDIEYGLTSGLHSLDHDEQERWLERVEAGNLYINRGITGAVVRRQPFGGWKKSAIGTGTKAGGPNYLHGLVDWQDAPVTEPSRAPRPQVAPLLAAAAEVGIAENDFAWLRAASGSDARAWVDEFGTSRDVSQLGVERNVLRYRPVPVTIRIAADASLPHAVRAIAAALAAEATPTVSAAVALPRPIRDAVAAVGAEVAIEDDAAWRDRIARLAAVDGPHAGARIRLVAGSCRRQESARVFAAAEGKPDIAVYDGVVVSAGRVEMLPHLREQAISVTAHRFGTPLRVLPLACG